MTLKVIAEGMETESLLPLLTDAGCDFAQGYYFSRPMPAEKFEALLRSGEDQRWRRHLAASERVL
jgi:EAL domain-containing protein (putative c-di-GMP-specific phosphodiesterase class I)